MKPATATSVNVGMAKEASRGPNHNSNIGTSSPARRWKIPSGQPFATTSATPSPNRTLTETQSHRSRRRVIAAEPQVPETRQLSKPHTVVNHPESLGSAIEWGSAVHHDVSLAACVPRGQVPIGMFNTLLVNLVLLIG